MTYTHKLDELNIPKYDTSEQEEPKSKTEYKERSMPYNQYFGEMGISEEQREERIEFSKQFEGKLLFLFALIDTMREHDMVNMLMLTETLRNAYTDVLSAYVELDDYLLTYADTFALQTVETTLENLETAYYLSKDRAMFIAENEANTSLNYKDFMRAILSGKKNKTWHTIGDNRVRKTHMPLSGKKTKITSPFMVGKGLMMFPKDGSMGAEAREIIGCRCWATYS